MDESSSSSDFSSSSQPVQAPPKKIRAVVSKSGKKKKKRSQLETYHLKIKRLENHVLRLKGALASFPALLIYKKRNEFHFVGNSRLEEAFRSSIEVKKLITAALIGDHRTNEEPRKTISSSYLDGNSFKTFLEKGVSSILMDDLRVLIVTYTTGGKRVSRFWGKLYEDLHKPTWWPDEVPFSSPNIRERDATEDKPVLLPDEILILGNAMRNHILEKSSKSSVDRCQPMENVSSTPQSVEEALDSAEEMEVESVCSPASDDEDAAQTCQGATNSVKKSTSLENDPATVPTPVVEIEVESVYSPSPDNEDAAQTCQGATNSVKKSTSLENDPATVPTPVVEIEVESVYSPSPDNEDAAQTCQGATNSVKKSTSLENDPATVPTPVVEIEVESVYSPSPDNEDAAQTCQGATNSVKKSTSLENDPATVPTPVVAKTRIKKSADLKSTGSPNVIPREQASKLAILSREYLKTFANCNWKEFYAKIKQIDKAFLHSCRLFIAGHQEQFTIRTMPVCAKVIEKSFERDDAVPPGLVPVTATGNGDCLFNSIGKLLFGSETVTPILRLVAAVLAVSHFKHYVEEYRERYLTRDCALQMLYSLSTPGVYERRPSFARKNASDVLRYAISSEIMEITKEKTFSGLLHVRFLATILSRSINLHCSYNDFYHGMMMPCLCSCDQLHDAINVMFVSVGRSVCPNHYIPLVWKIGTRSGAPALEESKHKQLCAATKLLGCQAIGEERQNWVSCRRCRLPYHAACSGIAAQRKEFVCCLDVETQELIRNDINAIGLHFYDRSCVFSWPENIPRKPKTSETKVIITMFDIYCIHSFGLTSSLINFYIRLLQNVIARKVSKVFVADTNQSKDIIENKRTATKIFPRDDLLDNDVLIFPYAITSCWHWVVAVLSLKDKWMCVLDSLNATGGSDRRLQYFERFVNLLQVQKRKDVTKFHEINCKIPVQERPDDCGVFTLYYAEKLMKEEYHIDETYGIVIQDLFNIGETLRKKIIRHMYDCQKKT